MLLSIALPILLAIIASIFVTIAIGLSGGDPSAAAGIGFIIAIIGGPFFFLIFIASILLSFFIGTLTKSRALLLISSIPIIAISYAFWKAHLPEGHSKGIIFDALAIFVIEYPRWLYIGYACLVLIVSGSYFYKKRSTNPSKNL